MNPLTSSISSIRLTISTERERARFLDIALACAGAVFFGEFFPGQRIFRMTGSVGNRFFEGDFICVRLCLFDNYAVVLTKDDYRVKYRVEPLACVLPGMISCRVRSGFSFPGRAVL